MNVRTAILLVFLPAILVGGLSACSSDDDANPTGPTSPDENEEILEPRFASIRTIKVDRFDATKGETNWDATLNIDGRRPDVYATMQVGTDDPFYTSTTEDDAEWNLRHDLSTAASGSAGLPRSVSVSSQLTFSLFDEDDISADDFMGAGGFVVGSRYGDDNAETFNWVVSGSGDVVFRVTGDWIY